MFNEIINSGNITFSNTVAPDGGGGAYIWIGGNDMATEGVWIWDGNNDGSGPQFWQGTSSGNPVGGLYSNWGNEPDDYLGQDGLALSLNGWPLGVAGEWNDVDDSNTLYYLIEIDGGVGMQEENSPEFSVFPNPAQDRLFVRFGSATELMLVVTDSQGRTVLTGEMDRFHQADLYIGDLSPGVYYISGTDEHGQTVQLPFIVMP